MNNELISESSEIPADVSHVKAGVCYCDVQARVQSNCNTEQTLTHVLTDDLHMRINTQNDFIAVQ